MNSIAAKLIKLLSAPAKSSLPPAGGVHIQRFSRLWQSTMPFADGATGDAKRNYADSIQDDASTPGKPETVLPGVDPRRGPNFRGVHKAIICGKVRETPVKKLLMNGKTLTMFDVRTGGMSDLRFEADKDMPTPPQWHHVVVHSELLGEYCVQKLVKNSSVYVEGDIELRLHRKRLTGQIVKLPEICVHYDGKVRLMNAGESINLSSLEELARDLQEKDASDKVEDGIVLDLGSSENLIDMKLKII